MIKPHASPIGLHLTELQRACLVAMVSEWKAGHKSVTTESVAEILARGWREVDAALCSLQSRAPRLIRREFNRPLHWRLNQEGLTTDTANGSMRV